VNQNNDPTTAKALNNSASYKHRRIHAQSADDATNQENHVGSHYDGLASKYIGEFPPKGY
jgi:hypothetical protein